jgi:hypothetical protein
MANQVATAPYSFTAPMAASFLNTSGAVPATGPLIISTVTWDLPANVGDAVTITDGKGMTLLNLVASARDVANGVIVTKLPAYESVSDFQVITINSGTLFLTTSETGAVGGQITTNGTAIAPGTSQAQGALAVEGMTAASTVTLSLAAVPAASWQTGINMVAVAETGQVVVYLENPTAGSITPAAAVINVRVSD